MLRPQPMRALYLCFARIRGRSVVVAQEPSKLLGRVRFPSPASMKRPRFKLQPVDEAFLASAPVVLSRTFEIGRPAGEVWSELVSDHPLAWCRILGAGGIEWTSERPFGVGTTRKVRALKGLSEMDEHFFIWDEGKRKAFYATEAVAPLFNRFAEDYRVEPAGEDGCVFTWTIAYEPTLLGKGPVNRAIMRSMFADTAKHYGTE